MRPSSQRLPEVVTAEKTCENKTIFQYLQSPKANGNFYNKLHFTILYLGMCFNHLVVHAGMMGITDMHPHHGLARYV